MKKFKNKNSLLVILGIIVICSLIGGTFAWFSWQAEDTTISGTTGAFVIPTTNPSNHLETIDIDSHLYEPSTIEEFPKLVPGLTFVKDPYVGIGAGSLDAAVFVYVDNNFSDKVYFELNEGWEVVEATEGYLKNPKTYTSGLFRYTEGLTNAMETDVWTKKPIFNEIIVDDNATEDDLKVETGKEPKIIVSSFIHQIKNISSVTILTAAKRTFGL